MGGGIGRDVKVAPRALALLTLALLVATALAAPYTTVQAEGHRSGLPDLTVAELYNVTPVVVGEESYFNVTLGNVGGAAYLVRSSGDLEVYAYRDGDTGQVDAFQRVYQDIYVGKNLTLNMKVRFDTVGEHSLLVVVDELDRVDEEDETNNQASVDFEVQPSEENRPPHADGGNDKTCYVDVPMTFYGNYSSDPDGDPLTFTWDFGDGSTGRGEMVDHTYAELGDYGASLTVSDGDLSDTDVFTVHVVNAPVNEPPTAVISVSSPAVEVGEEVTLDGLGSSDPDPGDALVYDWDLDASDGVDDWVRGPTTKASWAEPGSYTVTLRVSDGKATDTAERAVTVTEPPEPNESPSANAGEDISVKTGDTFTIYGKGSDPDGTVVLFEWDLDGDGGYDTYSEADGTLVHTVDEPGLHTLRLRVTDDDGATAEASVVVTVSKVADDGDVGSDLTTIGTVVMFALVAFVLIVVFARRGG